MGAGQLYKRIADEFIHDFASFEYKLVPFRWCDRPEQYVIGLWKGYFLNEITDLIKSEKDFADMVDGALANTNTYFRNTEKIDRILRRRFSVREA